MEYDLTWPGGIDFNEVPYMIVHYDEDSGVPTPLAMIVGAEGAGEVLKDLSAEDVDNVYAAYPVLLVP